VALQVKVLHEFLFSLIVLVGVFFGAKPARVKETYDHLVVVAAPARPELLEDTVVALEVLQGTSSAQKTLMFEYKVNKRPG